MKNLFKRVTSFITALAMTTTLTGGVQLVSFAEEEVFTAALTDEAYFSVDDFGLSDDELLLGYFENKLYGIDGGISTFAIPNTRSLTTKEKEAYDALKAAAEEIAKGDRASAEIDVVLTWTPSEAGLGENGAFTQTNIEDTFNNVIKTVDTGKVMSYLLADCPYEFYWFNKVAGMQIPVSMKEYTSTSLPITFKFRLSVGKEYADTADYTVDTTVTKAASAAATNAKAIVAENASKSDFERLTAYKDAICSLVSYDDEAVKHLNDSTYGVDPWQVIHVFDNDVNTEVVCEGYAKAFQYLCDLDNGGLTCYSVTGTMSGGTGAGGHMWNIVTLGGKNYLVDVTNCDTGTIGYSDELFLKGMTEEAAAKTYSKTIGSQKITFTYYDGTKEGTSNMADLFGTAILTLSTTDYSEAPKEISSIEVATNPTKTEYNPGDTFVADGLEINVNYSDGTSGTVKYSAGNAGDFDFEPAIIEADTDVVTVTYGEKAAEIPVTVSNIITITEDMLANQTSGTGWKIENSTLVLEEGYVFVIDETCSLAVNNFGTINDGTFYNTVNNRPSGTIAGGVYINTVDNYGTISDGSFPSSGSGCVYNYGTISGGDFITKVYNNKTITGGIFKIVDNDEILGTIALTTKANGDYSAKIEETIDDGKVTVDGKPHTHTLKVKSYNNFTDETHDKNEVCENCPVNYKKTTKNEPHDWVYTDADILIRANCTCGYYGGMFKLEAPADLTYNGEAKEATVNEIDLIVDDVTTPAIKYYDVNGNEAEPIDAGTYTAQIKIDDAVANLEFTIEKGTPDIGDVTVTPNTIYDSMTTDDLVFKLLNSKVDGEITIDADQTLVGGQFNNISWTFTPDDTKNYKVLTGTEEIYVNSDTVKSISVKPGSAKTEYSIGDKFDPTGLVITVTYASGTTAEIAYSNENKDKFTIPAAALAAGTSSVTIGYGGQTTDITVTAEKRELEISFPAGTEITYGQPAKIFVALYDGEKYVSEGSSVIAIYEDENAKFGYNMGAGLAATKTIDGTTYKGHIVTSNSALDYSIAGLKVGTIRASFDFEGTDVYAEKSYPFTITVNKLSDYEEYLTVEANGDIYTSTTVNEANAMLSGSVNINGNQYTGKVVFADSVTEFTTEKTEYSVIFTPDDENIEEIETTVSIEVAEDTITGIAVTGTLTKTEYVEGDKFDPTGLTVTATYASGATKEIEHELLTISPETLAKGNTSVMISYNGKTAEVDGITVRGKLKASDFAFTQPESCVYDKTAKAATVTAADGITGVGAITVRYFEGDTALDSAPVNAGTYKVVIDVAEGDNYVAATNLSGANWTFTIDKADPVINPSLKAPSVVYDTTSLEELSLNAGNSDGGIISFDGDITLEVGKKEYPVIFYPMDGNNYNTVKGTVEINVLKDVITKIKVTTTPTKTSYIYGEEFKADGLAITVTYLSGKTDVVKYADKPSEFSFTPDKLTVDTTKVIVTYAEKTAEISIRVAKATPEYDIPTNLKANYGDTLADVVLPDGWSWSSPNARIHLSGEFKSYAVYDNGDPNYRTVLEMLTINVSTRTISVESITVNDKDYDGTTVAVVNDITFTGIVNDDNIDYTATGTFADKNAGENKSVTVKVTVTNKNYTLDSDTFTTTATINKVNPDVTIPQAASAITGLALSNVRLPEGWAWDEPNTVPENGQTYGITYTPEDTANYNTLTAQVTVTVSDCTHPETRVDIKEATCTEDGLKTTICTICDKTIATEVIPAEHKWNSTYTVDTEATCTTEGEKSIHCKNCPEIKPDSAVTIPAGHKWNEKYSSDDTNHWIKCSGCDETKDKGAHSYGYTIDSKKYCSICGNSYGTAANGSDRNELGAGYTNPIHTAPKPTQPQIKDENGKTGWDVISDELALAQDGDTVVVDMNGTTKLPKSVLEDIEGRNIDLVLDMGSGITWTINGETVTNPKAVDLRVSKNVKRIPVNVIDNVTGDNFNMEISLAHNGEFGFEAMLTISLGRKYNDCYANLYYYNPSDKAMEFIDCDLIANGNAQLIFAHASDYAIVIDEEALGDDVSSAAGVTAESETMDTETVSVVFTLPLVLAAGFVIRKKLCR